MSSCLLLGLLASLFGQALTAPAYNARRSTVSASSNTDWTVYNVGGKQYFSSLEAPAATINSSAAYGQLTSAGRFALLPYTTITTNATTISADTMQSVLDLYSSTDDVWTESFLSTVFVVATSKKATLTSEACALILSKGASLVVTAGVTDASACTCLSHSSVSYPTSKVKPGPYIATYGSGSSSVDLYLTSGLFLDIQNAFIIGSYPSADGSKWYPFELQNGHSNLIPYPSRIPYLGDERPLAGWRVGIKDLYDMNGLVTTAGDRQYGETFGIVNVTCYAVQRLVDLGAYPVGKTKTAPFASGEENELWQWYMYPLNPRGDGFQTCSASSAGSGCAISAYDELDFCIGTDTGESVRRPSAVNGVYGGRPSQGMITLEDVIPLAGAEDTAGAMARDPYKFQTIIKNWYGQSNLTLPDVYSFPKKMYYPTDYFVGATPEYLAVVESFIGKLESEFGVVRQNINFTEYIFMQNAVFSNSNNILNEEDHYQFENLQYNYIQTFMAKNGGRFPSYDTQWRPEYQTFFINYTQNYYTQSDFSQAAANKSTLVNFIEDQFFKADSETCSDSFFIYDIGYGGIPFYREDDLNALPDYWAGVAANETLWLYAGGISPATATPDYVMTIGEVTYKSNVSLVEEKLPATLDIISRPGCDKMIVNFMAAMADKGLLKTVKTGRSAF